jgi:hypothetical protein
VQDVAHNALDAVGVHVPPGHNRYNDPTVCPGGPYRNHGAYVRAHTSDPNAGASPCGKPVQSVNPTGKPDADKNDPADKNDKNDKNKAHGHGKPDTQGPASSGAHPATKPAKPSTTPSSTAPTTTTSRPPSTTTSSSSTSSSTSTTTQP